MNIFSFFSVNDLVWYLVMHPLILLVIIGILFVISVCMGKEGNRQLLIVYLVGIIVITILCRPGAGRRAVMTPFWSYRYFATVVYFRRQILNNIFLFIPLGMILARIRPKGTTLLAPFCISTCVELLQYISGRGLCEFDDMLSNSLGGAIGFAIGIAWIFVVKAFGYIKDSLFS